jgi:hypothetical protein
MDVEKILRNLEVRFVREKIDQITAFLFDLDVSSPII